MPYWLTNPDHGTMPVYSQGDVERHKKMGWSLLNVGESPNLPPKRAAVAPPAPVVAAVPEMIALPVVHAEPEKRKPGRPRKA
jgi:hypothetical protein